MQTEETQILKPEELVTKYQNIITTTEIVEGEEITSYEIQEKSEEEIIAVNEEWFAKEYFLLPVLLPRMLYIPHTNYLNGELHNLIKDDLGVMLMGAATGQLTHLEVYEKPDMNVKIDEAIMEAKKVIITDENELTNIIGFIAASSFSQRKVPTVI